MRFRVDHDFHIHTYISPCAGEERFQQTTERILQYAVENGLKTIIATDHFWDSPVSGNVGWYQDLELNFEKLSELNPLPQSEGVRFLFGCETEMDQFQTIGLAKEHYNSFDFIIVPINHMHLEGISVPANWQAPVEERAELFVKRFQALLDSDLPLHKTGLAHMTDSLMANATWEDHIKTVDLIPDEVYKKLFNQAREKGLGIELNFRVKQYTEEEMERILRPYRIAKKCGCKFYLGSDAHRPVAFEGIRENFEKIVDMLALEETDKFHICTQK